MTTTTQHRGAGMNLVGELDVRAALLEGLHELAQDETELRQLVRRFDALNQGTQESWEEELLSFARDLLDPTGPHRVRVNVGYPIADAHLPWIGVVADQASEDEGGAVVGDILGEAYQIEGEAPDLTVGTVEVDGQLYTLPDPLGGTAYPERDPPRRAVAETTMGVDWTTALEVTCWATAPEAAMLLQAMARWALFRRKGDLHKSGAHDVSFAESGFTPHPKMEPRVGYVPAVRVTLHWTYRQTRRSRRMTYEAGVNLTTTICST